MAAVVVEPIGDMRVSARPRKRARVDTGDTILEVWGDMDEDDDDGEKRASSDDSTAFRKSMLCRRGLARGGGGNWPVVYKIIFGLSPEDEEELAIIEDAEESE